jgi:hypothetical protein
MYRLFGNDLRPSTLPTLQIAFHLARVRTRKATAFRTENPLAVPNPNWSSNEHLLHHYHRVPVKAPYHSLPTAPSVRHPATSSTPPHTPQAAVPQRLRLCMPRYARTRCVLTHELLYITGGLGSPSLPRMSVRRQVARDLHSCQRQRRSEVSGRSGWHDRGCSLQCR